MVQERRPGRPLKPLDPHLDPAVAAFAERIRTFYANTHVSLAQLGEALSCDGSTLSRYLSGATLPERGLLDRLYEAVERFTAIPVHEDARASTRELFYAACSVKDKPTYELYILKDKMDVAEERATHAEEMVDELQADLRAAFEMKQLTEGRLRQLQAEYSEHEADARRELQSAQDRHAALMEEIRALTEALRTALSDLHTAEAERQRLAMLLSQAEVKLEQEIQSRWADADQARPPEEAGPRLLGGRKRRKQIELLLDEARAIARRLPEDAVRLREVPETRSRINSVSVGSDELVAELARLFNEVYHAAVRLASEQALLRENVNSMFVNLSRRSQSLVQRQLRLIDELENAEQDPDQLANLFKLDHLATRMRRNGENLLVLAGEEPGRKWGQAVRLLDLLRASAAEVEQYERVQLRDLPDVNVVGRVVNDLVHLVAELLENATSFSVPETRVTVTANTIDTGGVMLEIEDAGIGMTLDELDDANERLANPPVIDVAVSRRMGLYVIGRLATRHGIQVRLRRSAGGGITALVLVPHPLLMGDEGSSY